MKMNKRDVLRSLRDCLLDEDTKIDVESIQRFRQIGVTRCTSRTGCLRGRGRVRSVFNQRVTRIISMHTLRYLLGETEHLWVCPECNDVSLVTNNQFCSYVSKELILFFNAYVEIYIRGEVNK